MEGVGESFWDFSLALYARPGVEPALLALQDEDGLEVNLVLFCLYAAARGKALDGREIDAMRQIGTAWGAGVVAPLRAARRALKPLASAPDTQAAALREEVKRAELAAEKLMQAALEALLPEKASAPPGSGRDLAELNLAAWLGSGGAPPGGGTGRLATLLDAGFGRR